MGHSIGLYQCMGKSKTKCDMTPIKDDATIQGLILHASSKSTLSIPKIVEIIGA
jgi:hypothetical protein